MSLLNGIKITMQRLQQEALDDGDAVIQRLSTYERLEPLIKKANEMYREGNPIVSDWFYDHILMKALKRKAPNHEWFQTVEPEPEEVFGKTVELPRRMLSTNKAYSLDEIKVWALNVEAASRALGIEGYIFFKVTPKFDGYAGMLWDGKLYTRGNGRQGTDISHVLKRGLTVKGGVSVNGPGEIVVEKDYFEKHLSSKYENSRNVIAACIKEGELDAEILDAILSEAVVFRPFSTAANWIKPRHDLLNDLEDIWRDSIESCKYDTDGLVIEAIDDVVKDSMGSTNHHHRWQIAFKKNTEFHQIEVTGIQWQTAKTGRVTPVVLLKPTKVSGVIISKATGHHAGNVISSGIDKGAIVNVCRSGQVIPYIEGVVTKADSVNVPKECPSCKSELKLDGDNLMCTNTIDCSAQIGRTIEYFFKTIGTCDGFGSKIIDLLVESGVKSPSDIYNMDDHDWAETDGIGSGVAANLIAELERSKREPIEDWRFLAAFSIPLVGKGGCEKILAHYRLEDVFNLSVNDVIAIEGFAEKTAKTFIESLKKIKSEVNYLMPMFMLKQTSGLKSEENALTGKMIVFTGSMQNGKREDMERQAKTLGAKVGSSVSGKTDYLVCGENVGASKIEAAKKHGVTVLSEADYLKLLGN